MSEREKPTPTLTGNMRIHDQEDADRRLRVWGPKDWASAIGALLGCLGALAALVTAFTALAQADATRVLVAYRVDQLEAASVAAKAEDKQRDERFFALVVRVEGLVARVENAVVDIERWRSARQGGGGPAAPPAPQPPAPPAPPAPDGDELSRRIERLTRLLDRLDKEREEAGGPRPEGPKR